MLDKQPDGYSELWEDLPVSIPLMVQSQCPMAEEWLQGMMDKGQIEVYSTRKGERDVCLQSNDKSSSKPKPLVIRFTGDVTTQKPEVSSLSQLRSLRLSLTKVIRWCRGSNPHKGPMEGRTRSSYMLRMTYPPLRSQTYPI